MLSSSLQSKVREFYAKYRDRVFVLQTLKEHNLDALISCAFDYSLFSDVKFTRLFRKDFQVNLQASIKNLQQVVGRMNKAKGSDEAEGRENLDRYISYLRAIMAFDGGNPPSEEFGEADLAKCWKIVSIIRGNEGKEDHIKDYFVSIKTDLRCNTSMMFVLLSCTSDRIVRMLFNYALCIGPTHFSDFFMKCVCLFRPDAMMVFENTYAFLKESAISKLQEDGGEFCVQQIRRLIFCEHPIVMRGFAIIENVGYKEPDEELKGRVLPLDINAMASLIGKRNVFMQWCIEISKAGLLSMPYGVEDGTEKLFYSLAHPNMRTDSNPILEREFFFTFLDAKTHVFQVNETLLAFGKMDIGQILSYKSHFSDPVIQKLMSLFEGVVREYSNETGHLDMNMEETEAPTYEAIQVFQEKANALFSKNFNNLIFESTLNLVCVLAAYKDTSLYACFLLACLTHYAERASDENTKSRCSSRIKKAILNCKNEVVFVFFYKYSNDINPTKIVDLSWLSDASILNCIEYVVERASEPILGDRCAYKLGEALALKKVVVSNQKLPKNVAQTTTMYVTMLLQFLYGAEESANLSKFRKEFIASYVCHLVYPAHVSALLDHPYSDAIFSDLWEYYSKLFGNVSDLNRDKVAMIAFLIATRGLEDTNDRSTALRYGKWRGWTEHDYRFPYRELRVYRGLTRELLGDFIQRIPDGKEKFGFVLETIQA